MHIVICVSGGIVDDVLSDTPDIEVTVIDWDDLIDDIRQPSGAARVLAEDDIAPLLTSASRSAIASGNRDGDLEVDRDRFPYIL